MPDGSIGTPIKRREDHRFLTGAGRYVDDFDRPGRIHVSMVRSPVGHAKIPNVDTSKAEAEPGVVKSLKGADWAADEVGALSGGWRVIAKNEMPATSHKVWQALQQSNG
jgi:carbon-monoxide dehydrogenase large subunit